MPPIAAVPAALRDRSARMLHAARHAVPRRADAARVFDLDLHVAVIADVRDALAPHGVGVTDWTLSGHAWVMGRRRDPVAVLNERTAAHFGPELIRRFRRVYGGYLRGFRGYVATHTPCFSLLYEDLPGPTLAICSTRYEWPFTFDRARWEWLDERLLQGVQDGWLHVIANNRADAGYVEHYLGLTPHVIPSACDYVPAYTGRRPDAVVAAKSDRLAADICGQLAAPAVPLRGTLGKRYRWRDLYDHRAIVFIPYNVSVMALFEHYSACAPVYVPTPGFLKELMAAHPEAVLSQLSYAQESTLPATPPRVADGDLNDLNDPAVVQWYLDRADFYDPQWMPAVRQFESWAHLDHLLATDDHAAISSAMAQARSDRLARIAELWDRLEWLQRVARASGG